MSKKNLLIAGCGDVGSALAMQILNTGKFNVWGMRRTISALPEGVRPIQSDLTDSAKLGEWPEKIDYVVYAAAADSWGEEGYRNAYATGLTNVLDKLRSEGHTPKRVFFTSSTGVYHQSQGEWVDENSATSPTSFSGKIMLEAEQLLADSEFPGTSVRFGGIYGPGRDRMINRVKQGGGCASEPVIYGNRIHRDDCAGLLAFLISKDMDEAPLEQIYLGVDDAPVPIHEVLQWLAEQLEVVLDNSFPLPQRANRRCRNQRILDAGYPFIYSNYRAGYTALINQKS